MISKKQGEEFFSRSRIAEVEEIASEIKKGSVPYTGRYFIFLGYVPGMGEDHVARLIFKALPDPQTGKLFTFSLD